MNSKSMANSMYEQLCNGRSPFAFAKLCGTEVFPAVRGEVSFYDTPVGVLFKANIKGFPRCESNSSSAKAYNFCLRKDGELCRSAHGERGKAICIGLPTVYERCGEASCMAVTKRIDPSELEGKILIVHERLGDIESSCTQRLAVAKGRVEYIGA